MKYRSDIDGLRTVAVVPVILSHAGVSAFAGGFVGVDIFFVISGFLITRILIGDLDAKKYSLLNFYERRARRIMPALLVVIAACCPFALWLLLPDFLENFGQSVVATLLFANNLLLAKTSGYWELESNFKPLLHTWSLGVEEQFYLVYPLILAALWRFGRRVQLAAIAILGIVSFALAQYGLQNFPSANFYLPTSRAWELMVGCAVAYATRVHRPTDQIASLAGLLAIFYSIFFFTEHTPTPSHYSAIPVLGTAAVLLFSREGTIAFRLLSLRPMVGIGLISYSAYLWHQPLFAFARIASLQPPSMWVMSGLIVLTFVLAWLSWRFIEQPFRNPKSMPIIQFSSYISLASAAAIAFGLALHFCQGFPKWTYPNIGENGNVYISYNERIRKYRDQVFPDNDKHNVLVIGNSYARDMANVLLESDYSRYFNLIYLYNSTGYVDSKFLEGLSKELLSQADSIVLAAKSGSAASMQQSIAELAKLTQAETFIFGPKDFGYNLNPYGRVAVQDRNKVYATVPESVVELNVELKQRISADHYIDLLALLGRNGKGVRVFDEQGNPLSPDRLHLTRFGAIFIKDQLESEAPLLIRRITGAAEQLTSNVGN